MRNQSTDTSLQSGEVQQSAPQKPVVEGFDVHDSPLHLSGPTSYVGMWSWTAYKGSLGYELICDGTGKVAIALRVPQIDCEDDDEGGN